MRGRGDGGIRNFKAELYYTILYYTIRYDTVEWRKAQTKGDGEIESRLETWHEQTRTLTD